MREGLEINRAPRHARVNNGRRRPGRSPFALALVTVALTAGMLIALGCGGGNDMSAADHRRKEASAAPRYAATPRAVLESWVTAVRIGDTGEMCRLRHVRAECSAPMLNEQLPTIRAEMDGLEGRLRYGALDIARGHTLIGVVSGDSPFAYAVPVSRGSRQWGIRPESHEDARFAKRVVLTQPDPMRILARGPTEISFTVWSPTRYPDIWINGRAVKGRWQEDAYDGFVYRMRGTGVARLSPGRNMMVVVSRGYPIAAWAWVLTAR